MGKEEKALKVVKGRESRVVVHPDGMVEIKGLKNKEQKKKKILEALLATGIDPVEIPALTVELLAERVPAAPFSGVKTAEPSIVNLTASAMAGAAL
jgi:hypothetical protein